jgi:tryptophan-rich sensory protein
MKYLSFIPFLLLVIAAASTGALFMPGEWYQSLNKPSWTPPDWLFGPAWTILYVLIAIAGWKVWQVQGMGPALIVWFIGLGLNALWSYLMFGAHRIDLALYDAIGMLVSIIAFIVLSWGLDKGAALLFVPYLAWVSFATALNLAILRLNA